MTISKLLSRGVSRSSILTKNLWPLDTNFWIVPGKATFVIRMIEVIPYVVNIPFPTCHLMTTIYPPVCAWMLELSASYYYKPPTPPDVYYFFKNYLHLVETDISLGGHMDYDIFKLFHSHCHHHVEEFGIAVLHCLVALQISDVISLSRHQPCMH